MNNISINQIQLFDNSTSACIGLLGGQVDISNISHDNWDISDNTATYETSESIGGNADIYYTTTIDQGEGGEGGYTENGTGSMYMIIDNSELSNEVSYIQSGNYIIKPSTTNEIVFEKPSGTSHTIEVGLSTISEYLSYTISVSTTPAPNPDADHESTGPKNTFTFSANAGLTVYQTPQNPEHIPSLFTSQTSYVYKIERKRLDNISDKDTLHYYQNPIVLIENEKIATELNIDISQTDQYGLWFNAEYEYIIYGRNVITGEDVTQSTTIITKPYIPVNFYQVLEQNNGSTSDSYVKLYWETHEATGNATTNSYILKRTGYTVNESNNSSIYGSNEVTINNNALNYDDNINNYLYGKVSFEYSLRNIENINFVDADYKIDLPDYDASGLNVTVVAGQNPIDSIIYETDSFNNSLTNSSNYLLITIDIDYTFDNNTTPTYYQVFEKYYLIGTINSADLSGNNTIILGKHYNDDLDAISMADESVSYINVIAGNDNNKSSCGDTLTISCLSTPEWLYHYHHII